MGGNKKNEKVVYMRKEAVEAPVAAEAYPINKNRIYNGPTRKTIKEIALPTRGKSFKEVY